MKTRILCVVAIMNCFALLSGCNSNEKKKETDVVKPDTTSAILGDTSSPRTEVVNNTDANNVAGPYVMNITPTFNVVGKDGKDWDTQIEFNLILNGENLANFDSPDYACCSSGKKGESPNPTDWNSGDLIPQGIKTLPGYKINRADITKDMLANSSANFIWRPLGGKDASDGIKWTLTARFSDNTQVVYSRVETFANQHEPQPKKVVLKDIK